VGGVRATHWMLSRRTFLCRLAPPLPSPLPPARQRHGPMHDPVTHLFLVQTLLLMGRWWWVRVELMSDAIAGAE